MPSGDDNILSVSEAKSKKKRGYPGSLNYHAGRGSGLNKYGRATAFESPAINAGKGHPGCQPPFFVLLYINKKQRQNNRRGCKQVMVIHESAENYLESIFVLQKKLGKVRSIDIVNDLGFSKPSISVAMKRLRENGYIEMDAEGYITLKEKGLTIARRIYERHQLLSQFLICIGVSEATALEDACKIEHDLSDESFEAMKAHALGFAKKGLFPESQTGAETDAAE